MQRLRFSLLFLGLSLVAPASMMVYVRDAAPAENPYHNGLYRSNAGYLGTTPVRAGLFRLEQSATGPDGIYFDLFTYCADPYLPLSIGPVDGAGVPFELVSLSAFGYSATSIELISKLYGNVYYDSHSSATKAAAFQFLLWEYISDPSFNLNSGFTRITNADVRNQALAWHQMQSTWTQYAALSVLDGRADGRQSFFLKETMMVIQEAENPEPSSLLLLGAGLVGIFLKRKR